MNKLEFYDELCFRIATLYAEAGALEGSSMEGLGSNVIGRLFVSIVDAFAGVLTSLTTNMTRCFKSLKRSELNEFVQSNRLRVMSVDSLNYEDVIDTPIDVPANMKGTYKQAVESLVAVYTKLNALNTTKLANTSFASILNAINTSDPKLSKQIDSAFSVISQVIKNVKPAVDTCLSQFDGKFTYKTKFGKVFLTMDEWKAVRTTLIENECRLQDVKALTDLTSETETTLKSIASAVDADSSIISPKDLRNLGEMAKNTALVLDAYGMAATRQMAIEHNYVLCVNQLFSKPS